MRSGDRLRVIDDAPLDADAAGKKGKRLPFKTGDVVTCRAVLKAGPDGSLELREHRGFYRAARFAPVEA